MEDDRLNLKVEGMTCNHCASTVSGIIKQEGGEEIHVDYLMGEANFDLRNTQKMERILKRLKDAGYKAQPESDQNEVKKGFSSIEKKFLFTLPFSLILFMHMFVPHDWWLNKPLVQLGFCLPVYFMGVYHFGKSTLESIKSGNINMDVLILLGSSSAFFYSLYGTIAHPGNHAFLFYETTSTIITLVLLGYVIEHRAVKRTTSTLRELFKAKPEKAKKLIQNGLNQDLKVVNASSLKPDDIVLINAGDRAPADGVLIHGNITVDEAMLTGEAEEINKQKGDEILSGSVVIDGNGTLKVERAGSESTIGQIVELVKKSRSDKPAVQKLADRISSWFVPVIIGIALLAFALNFWVLNIDLGNSILRSVAVLVIACPCAMGLATPTAVSVGLGLAAKLGIIVKRASVFEELNAIDTFVFDKTGTLTTGKLEIILSDSDPDVDQELVWRLIKTLETRSNHPLSASFLKLTEHLEEVEMSDIEEVKGKGLKGTYQGKTVSLGKSGFSDAENPFENGDLYLALGDKVIAVFSVKDALKEDAQGMIQKLQRTGKHVSLLSGDRQEKTAEIARVLGIKTFKGDQLPEDKLRALEELKTKHKVAMVGDGINDSPALAKADVGISIGNANALAGESAKVVIIGSKLQLITHLNTISKKVVSTIKQNLFWAFSYNLVAIPLAALGYLDPMLAALSMAFSDVIVIGNSLRLRMVLPKSVR
ncbi:MAG: cation-translocating P-type ATPase [Salibacteraceae bacterium]